MNRRRVKSNIKLIIASMTVCINTAGLAGERGQSVMFPDKLGNHNDTTITTTHSPINSAYKTDNNCEKMIKEIDKLKGKPQRRHAAIQRFKQECSSVPPND